MQNKFAAQATIPFCIIRLCLLSVVLLGGQAVWSEPVENDTTEAVVLGKVLQNQQQASHTATDPVSTTARTKTPEVNTDMAEGESIRRLPTLNQPVVDQAGLLTAAEKQAIDQKILNLYQQGKAQVGIIIVPTTGQEDIFDFAMRAANQWKLGSAEQDNGLLMAIAVNDHRIQILSGYGLEGVLPDIVLSRIIRNQITPFFKQGQYIKGINAGLNEIERILNLDPEIAQRAAEQLKLQQEQALHEQQAKERTFNMGLFILIAGIFGSFIVGNRLSASTAGVAAVATGLVNGAGVVTSLLLGFGIFFLLITSIAQTILHLFIASRGGGGGGRGGFGGGGFSGGGGGFGGGGASGSW